MTDLPDLKRHAGLFDRMAGALGIDLEEEASERITAFLQVRTPIVHPDA